MEEGSKGLVTSEDAVLELYRISELESSALSPDDIDKLSTEIPQVSSLPIAIIALHTALCRGPEKESEDLKSRFQEVIEQTSNQTQDKQSQEIPDELKRLITQIGSSTLDLIFGYKYEPSTFFEKLDAWDEGPTRDQRYPTFKKLQGEQADTANKWKRKKKDD